MGKSKQSTFPFVLTGIMALIVAVCTFVCDNSFVDKWTIAGLVVSVVLFAWAHAGNNEWHYWDLIVINVICVLLLLAYFFF